MEPVQISPRSLQHTWSMDGIPVLQAEIQLPEFTGAGRGLRRINRFYRLQERVYLRYCRRFLLPAAQQACRESLRHSAPLPLFRAELSFCVTWQSDNLCSLYTQSRETGAGLLLRRWGDTWDLKKGYPLPVTICFPSGKGVRRCLAETAVQEIRRQEAIGTACFCDDWPRRLRRCLNLRNFYLTPEGLRFFFPMYSIGPAAEGIPVFSIPFGQEGCSLPDAEKPPHAFV